MLKLAALLYDRFMDGVEQAGLTGWRRELLAPLRGSVLEIGAGTGRNLLLYPAEVTDLVVTEPDPHMRTLLAKAVSGSARQARVIDAPAEHLPFADATFDAVVSTLVLCSVKDQACVLKEVRRVLRPGGELVFIEHVAATDRPRRLRWQRRAEPIWRLLAGNCHLTRDTADSIAAAGFVPSTIVRESMRKSLPIVRPTIRGRATRDS
ncbi:MAG: class I SAM-dependent methyltransferase [Acidimicrobiales bacterium]